MKLKFLSQIKKWVLIILKAFKVKNQIKIYKRKQNKVDCLMEYSLHLIKSWANNLTWYIIGVILDL